MPSSLGNNSLIRTAAPHAWRYIARKPAFKTASVWRVRFLFRYLLLRGTRSSSFTTGSWPFKAQRGVNCPTSTMPQAVHFFAGKTPLIPVRRFHPKRSVLNYLARTGSSTCLLLAHNRAVLLFLTGEQPQDIATRLEMLVNQTARRSAIQTNGAEVSHLFKTCKIGDLCPNLTPLHANLKNCESSIFHLLPKAFLGVFRVMRRISIREHA